jgi:hypothetical protein
MPHGMLAKKIAVGFGIAVIFPMLAHYGARTLQTPPHWEDYARPMLPGKYETLTPEERLEFETEQQELETKRRAEEKKFQKVLFSVTVPSGIAAILAGAWVPLAAVGTGLIFGGILSLIDGYIHYWSELPDGLRFLSLLAGFGVLLFVGMRKLKGN